MNRIAKKSLCVFFAFVCVYLCAVPAFGADAESADAVQAASDRLSVVIDPTRSGDSATFNEKDNIIYVTHKDALALNAVIDAEGLVPDEIVWTSSDEAVASIAQDGTVTTGNKIKFEWKVIYIELMTGFFVPTESTKIPIFILPIFQSVTTITATAKFADRSDMTGTVELHVRHSFLDRLYWYTFGWIADLVK